MDPRVARSREKICRATVEQLVEHGYANLTIEGIAAHAGVGKTTIYRHWDSLAQLVQDAVRQTRRGHEAELTGDLRTDVLAFLAHLTMVMSKDRSSSVMHALLSAADRDPELAELHADFVAERRRPLREVIVAAVEAGDLDAATDPDLAVDLLTAPFFLRRFISRGPIDEGFAEQLVDTVLPALRGASA